MITWLQNATSKHHRTIFGFLLVIVVVSFVGYGFVGRGDLGLNSELRYMGVDLADARNRQRYYFDCQTFSLGRIQGLTIQQRIAELHLADELGIPEPTEGEVRRIARQMSQMFATGADGKPSDDGVAKFIAFASRQLSVNEQEAAIRYETFIKDTWRINKLYTTLSGKGHATAGLLKRQLDRSRTLWTTDVATFAAKEFKPTIADDEAKIKEAFEKNKEAYRLPPRVEVAAVTVSKLTPDTTPITDDEIVNYGYNLAEKFKFETGKVKEQALAKRDEIEKIIRQDRAVTRLAGQVSDELAEKFPTDATKAGDAGFAKWLKDRGAVVKTLPAFDAGAAPTVEKVPAEALRAAGELTDKEWRTEVYRTEDAVVFLTAGPPGRRHRGQVLRRERQGPRPEARLPRPVLHEHPARRRARRRGRHAAGDRTRRPQQDHPGDPHRQRRLRLHPRGQERAPEGSRQARGTQRVQAVHLQPPAQPGRRRPDAGPRARPPGQALNARQPMGNQGRLRPPFLFGRSGGCIGPTVAFPAIR